MVNIEHQHERLNYDNLGVRFHEKVIQIEDKKEDLQDEGKIFNYTEKDNTHKRSRRNRM